MADRFKRIGIALTAVGLGALSVVVVLTFTMELLSMGQGCRLD